MTVITEEMKLFFQENGYILIKNAVPKENCERAVNAIWEFMGKDPGNQESWYTPPAGMDELWHDQQRGMIPFIHHPSLWDNRQFPRLYQAFAELLEEEKLWVTVDRVNMKPPKREDKPELNTSFIHWDTDTTNLTFPLPRPRPLQGVLFLEDTNIHQGGFRCVPSIYKDFEQWIKEQPADRNPINPDYTGHEVKVIPGEAGDLLLWDVLVAHGNGENLFDRPRLAQYITMFPAKEELFEERRRLALESLKNKTSMHQQSNKFNPFLKDPRDWEHAHTPNDPELTVLGRKLLGLEAWNW
ncbi:phytanoyl-CoA dioxygenase family protein [Paenibacillus radicis (ex Xue et al. 2023)]|uniref:Phytanoyl-CoA dioxygenase family protein n=1 Tax=Paenibacillus radicis (ex Xue et al. 2023) TaxID=2972489 RepID=A0ABT1YHV4_9BACL|nr:phytanoyl-CoA dioxygenase family protein [Paenibacillus radicis (ex Xue et al. 2023)]MCR8632769.1 phytanoyl-CoA dioxygenase family protein [Paenibacillus radicis (ex Xue et al. 2023)]